MDMSAEYAIKVEQVDKMYKLYDKPMDRLKESLGLSRQKKYKEHYALHNVNFDVKKGETVGIIGTNGSGKSTILKIITGVLNPTAGNVTVDGRISALLELGAGFNGEYSGIENIYLNGTMIGFSREEIDAKLQDILDFADIGDFVHQPVKTYSSGMFVRLAFAVAINIEPEILIVDEALSVGDVFFQAKCYHKFEEFKKMGKTILFVSHDLGSVAKYCDRVILLNKGKKLSEGSPKEMIDIYKKLLVNQYDAETGETLGDTSSQEELSSKKERTEDGKSWKSHFRTNPSSIEYGSKEAEITDFGILDEDGFNNAIEKGKEFTIKLRIDFHEDVTEPIFAFTIKDLKGTEIAGTNTLFEGQNLPFVTKGESKVISFTQKADLQGGEYLLSFGCTGYTNGEFTVYHRLYDVINLTVVSRQNKVGYYDMNSKIIIE
jgi:teichoic acid transport system ATP-binding protein